MKVVFTSLSWAEVDSHEQAADLAVEADEQAILTMQSAAARRGKDMSAYDGVFGYLGTSFWVIDDAVEGVG